MEDIQGQDANLDIVIDNILGIRYDTLMQVQFNIEEYVEGALEALGSKLNGKLKKKTKHLAKQLDLTKETL